ncbi:TolC family protein [Sorangium sp. So ce394]|uniref:TolC family protein n=1 Tax=Sorangium sp. So ce394 TaxID=3133310 RepID=UPI003F5C5DB7
MKIAEVFSVRRRRSSSSAASAFPRARSPVWPSIACLSLAACAAPAQLEGSERAIALYREARAAEAQAEPRGGAGLGAGRRAAPRELSADEAVAMAKERSATLAMMRAREATARARVDADAAGTYRNPEIRVSQLRLDQVLDHEPRLAAGVRIRPPRPGEAGAAADVARADVDVARAETRVSELELEAEVRWLFDDVLLLDAEIEALEAVAATRRRLADQERARVSAAQGTAVDEAMAALSAAVAEEDGAAPRARREVARAALLERVGVDPAAPVRLVGEPVASAPLVALASEEALIEAALRNRPEIALAAAEIDGAGAEGALARATRWPWLSFIEFGYEFSPATRDPLGWTLEAGLELPLFDTRSSEIAAADAGAIAAQRTLAAEVQRVAREVRDRLREARAAGALVEEFRARALPAVERAGIEVARALESRQIDAVRALSLEERRAAAQVKLLKLVREYRTALAELRVVVGGPLDGRAPAARR